MFGVPVVTQQAHHSLLLVGVCHKHLEHMKCLKLNALGRVLQESHHSLQVLQVVHVLDLHPTDDSTDD